MKYTRAVYFYRDKVFITQWISTIDTYYGKYTLI